MRCSASCLATKVCALRGGWAGAAGFIERWTQSVGRTQVVPRLGMHSSSLHRLSTRMLSALNKAMPHQVHSSHPPPTPTPLRPHLGLPLQTWRMSWMARQQARAAVRRVAVHPAPRRPAAAGLPRARAAGGGVGVGRDRSLLEQRQQQGSGGGAARTGAVLARRIGEVRTRMRWTTSSWTRRRAGRAAAAARRSGASGGRPCATRCPASAQP